MVLSLDRSQGGEYVFIEADTLDDVLHRVLPILIKTKLRIRTSSGPTAELRFVLLKITNPRARLSRSEMRGRLFSCLGELMWYLAGTNSLEFIKYYIKDYTKYSDDGSTIHGGYGPRLFRMRRNDQVSNVIALLGKRPTSRRAVIQLFDSSDIAKPRKDIPCTCTLQFMIRDGRLDMLTSMRSNDAFLGLPHDVFAFTMFQELIGRSLGVRIGCYHHVVGSLHLYEKHRLKAHRYLKEGWQPTAEMPPMPSGDPWSSIDRVLKAESQIREGRGIVVDSLGISPYWTDIVRLLQIYRNSRYGSRREIERLKGRMSSRIYDPYIESKTRVSMKQSKRKRSK